MKRDDFGVRIDEIRELATKYNKQELGRMVQMGVLDPQRALMAGMMIDRIAQSATEMPQSTVAEDVLAPTTAQQQIPAGIMGAPNAPPPSAGVATLPSGIAEMAGGGIVAFADGGEADVPGYADRGYVDSRKDPAMRISPEEQRRRDINWALPIRMRELQEARRSGDAAAIAAAERQVRQITGEKPTATGGIYSLFPAAGATTMDASAKTQTGDVDYFQDPFGAPSYTVDPNILKEKVEKGKTYDPSLRGAIFGYEQVEPKQPTVTPKSAEVKPVETKVEPSVTKTEEKTKPKEEKTIEPPAKITAQQIDVPTQKVLKDEIDQVREAYREAGVDVDMYKNMMTELKDKKAALSERKNQALGFALLSLGVGLSGARQGQEFKTLGEEGQKALGLYMNSMEKIIDNEQQLDALNRQLAMAENNFKRTGADSALAQVRARQERIEQVQAKNAELRQTAEIAQAQVGATVYGAQLGAEVRKEIMEIQAAAKVEAAKASAGKAGALTQKQEFDIRQQLKMELEPKLRAQYKNFGSDEQIDKKVQQEMNKIIDATIGEIRSRSAGYGSGAAPQDMFQDWSVEGL